MRNRAEKKRLKGGKVNSAGNCAFCLSKNKHSARGLAIFFFTALLFSISFAEESWAETASYYTYESCKREGTSGIWTASGERFNENDLTCAMWKVKFGAFLKVTNLANGKSVIVRCNDRGPAKRLVKKGRIIDLSKGAFLRIANLKDGVIKVKVEKL